MSQHTGTVRIGREPSGARVTRIEPLPSPDPSRTHLAGPTEISMPAALAVACMSVCLHVCMPASQRSRQARPAARASPKDLGCGNASTHFRRTLRRGNTIDPRRAVLQPRLHFAPVALCRLQVAGSARSAPYALGACTGSRAGDRGARWLLHWRAPWVVAVTSGVRGPAVTSRRPEAGLIRMLASWLCLVKWHCMMCAPGVCENLQRRSRCNRQRTSSRRAGAPACLPLRTLPCMKASHFKPPPVTRALDSLQRRCRRAAPIDPMTQMAATLSMRRRIIHPQLEFTTWASKLPLV